MRTAKNIHVKRLTFPIVLAVLVFFSLTMNAQIASLSDANVTDQIDKEFFMSTNIPADKINVSTDEGIVTLTGTVSNILAKDRAERQATAVKGVRGVVNRIDVNAPDRNANALRQDIQNTLLMNPATESYEIDIAVANGFVTLSGVVDSWQEKNLAAYLTKSVNGVKGIDNNITVDLLENRSDAEIKEDITSAINNDIRLYRSLIDADVNNGTVQLEGTVGSMNEKNLAINYAWTSGVKEVDAENLQIKDWAHDKDLRKQQMPMRSDAQIKDAVKDAFFYDPRVKSFNPEVKVNAGIVTLSGEVDNLEARSAAEADARNVVGVLSVRNNIKVKPELMPVDEVIENNVEKAFERNALLNDDPIDVSVNDGYVYLTGNVDTYYEKNEANREARMTTGALRVVNNLFIDADSEADLGKYYYYSYEPFYPDPFIYPEGYYETNQSDWEIKKSIEDEIWWSPFVNLDDITVTVDQGVATLDGMVDTWYEQSKAVENAYEGGAVSVIDKMAIEHPEMDQ